MKRHAVYLCLTLLLAFACNGTADPDYESRLVVEASIFSGEAPEVILTMSLPPGTPALEAEVVGRQVVEQALVTISDGTKEVLLTGRYREGAVPPYVYTCDDLKGEEGKTYTLHVETPSHKAKATARIPAAVPLTDIVPDRYGNADSTWLLRARFRDPEGERNFYKFFSRIEGVDRTYCPTRLDLIDDAVLVAGTETEVIVLPGATLFVPEGEDRSCYHSGDTVHVRFCTMTEEITHVWSVYDSEAIRILFPILSSVGNLPGNVEGALGYFAGYGCHEQRIVIDGSPR